MSHPMIYLLGVALSALSVTVGIAIPYFSYSPARGFLENYFWSQIYGFGFHLEFILGMGHSFLGFFIWPLIVFILVAALPVVICRASVAFNKIHIAGLVIFIASLFICFWSARADKGFYHEFNSYAKNLFIKF